MSEKRRGLGRGLGALIPGGPAPMTRPAGERPVDVFFADREEDAPGTPSEGGGRELAASVVGAPSSATGPTTGGAGTSGVGGATGDRGGVATRPGRGPLIGGPSSPLPGSGRPPGLPTALQGAPASAPPLPPPPAGAPPARLPADLGPSARLAPSAPGVPSAPSPAEGWGDGGATSPGDDGASVPLVAPAVAAQPAADPDGLVPVPGAYFAELPVDAIRPNPKQPRQVFDEEALAELVHSVKEIGILQPVVVRRLPAGSDTDGDDGAGGEPQFELIMGERRLRACREAGLERIPAIVRDTQDDALLRDALLENLHRSQLNPLEEAAAYQQLLDDFGCTHEELASRIGRSRPQISNTLRLLKLPPLVQRRVAAAVLSAGHARALLGLEDSAAMERLAQRIVAEGLSVRAVEEIVALGDGTTAKPAKRRPRAGAHTSELDELASRLGDRLDTRVAIALGRSKGRLSIDFASVDDLNRIMGLLSPEVRKAFREE